MNIVVLLFVRLISVTDVLVQNVLVSKELDEDLNKDVCVYLIEGFERSQDGHRSKQTN